MEKGGSLFGEFVKDRNNIHLRISDYYLIEMLLFLFLLLFFFYFFSFCSMTLDVIPQNPICNNMGCVGGCGIIPSDTKGVCVYSCPMEGKCPCFPKAPEPSPEVLEENQHKKEIRSISRSTQKLVYELQHAKMKLALLKLTQEMEQISSIAPLHNSETQVPEQMEVEEKEEEEEEEEEVIEK
jgi:hypothetical protein